MKESEDKNWKEGVLKNFEKPTHTGFNEEVMGIIEELENKPALNPAPLISLRQWFFTVMIASLIVLTGVFVQYQIELDFGFVETYSLKVMDWINANLMVLWIAFAVVSVFFVITLMTQKRILFK